MARRDIDPLGRIVVTRHARERAVERFHAELVDRIVGEIRVAVIEGRVANLPPAGLRGSPSNGTWYAWTPVCDRVYVLRACRGRAVVLTVLDPHEGEVESGPPVRAGFRYAAA